MCLDADFVNGGNDGNGGNGGNGGNLISMSVLVFADAGASNAKKAGPALLHYCIIAEAGGLMVNG